PSPPATPDTAPGYSPAAASGSVATAYADTAGSGSRHSARPPACGSAACRQCAPALAPARAKTCPATSSPRPPPRHTAAAVRSPGPPRTCSAETPAPETSAPSSRLPQLALRDSPPQFHKYRFLLILTGSRRSARRSPGRWLSVWALLPLGHPQPIVIVLFTRWLRQNIVQCNVVAERLVHTHRMRHLCRIRSKEIDHQDRPLKLVTDSA